MLIKTCKLVYFLQEMNLLREAVFPYLLCSSAREGNIEAMERLRQAVDCSLNDFSACQLYSAVSVSVLLHQMAVL